MDVNRLVARIKRHPGYADVGMILCHNGVVRSWSRDGRRVSKLRVAVDHDRLNAVIQKARRHPGIVDVQVDIAHDRELAVGEDLMLLAVAGDVRETVIAVLRDTLEAIKTSVTKKTEFYR
jgi:molybdopterin synthase catalytic subunit